MLVCFTPTNFLRPEVTFSTLEYMIIVGMYVWDRCKLVPEIGVAGAQS